MNGVLAVYHKEMRHYFRSPIAYFVVAVFLVGTGYFFNYNIFLTGVASMDETFQNMGMLLVVLSPVISMRLFAGEYGDGTMELLCTLPLRPWELVLGKYLGALTLLLLMAAGTAVDLVPLYLFGEPDSAAIASGYIGFVLLGMACLAVGQFFSVLTGNQIVAALITVAVLLAFWFKIAALAVLLAGCAAAPITPEDVSAPQQWGAAENVTQLRHLYFSAHSGDFIRGLVRSEAVVYYLVVSGIALALNAAYLEWRR